MGREFLELFEQWADYYDETVVGHDEEYKEVFLHYDRILEEVTKRSKGHVVEFGVGTGNLTTQLLNYGLQVTGIEPSPAMRSIANEKLGQRLQVLDGDFMTYPDLTQVDTFVSTYAFHHLTDVEKEHAIEKYSKQLASGGKIVFADTMYESEEAYKGAITDALSKGYLNLANDLQTEYYTTIPILRAMLEKNGFDVRFSKCNEFVWILEAEKK
ncbi:class I SAM-dependent methyltransferase [Bacillus sp. CGMCC 1.16607]|uniref:class I SAM-dependent methyltransferase n=1 Tax=Bacillus sp. CGMCC 1.16607 TaxID=3351842 RepID=UPI003632B4AA